jgi:class 3 adenylate cyclase/tetratricopeptide (TPR) repeat protein
VHREEALDWIALVKELGKTSLADLDALYAAREQSGLENDPDASVAIAQRALSLGEPLLAYDLCRFALQGQPEHRRLRQLQALALARCGATERAREVLERLYQEGSRDEETLGMLARIYKDRALESPNSADSQAALGSSLKLYTEAYQSAGGYWSGINAATIALATGNAKMASELANRVKIQCQTTLDESPSEIWKLATLGEAALITGDLEEAQLWYARALVAGAGFGDRASMRRNARLALDAKGRDVSWLDQVLPRPVIALFSGHMLDQDGRSTPRFPEALSTRVGEVLKARLISANAQIGFAAAASGGDILFHEAMLDLGRETHVVLPAPPEKFVRNSVMDGHLAWSQRFRAVLDRATSVVVHSNSTSGDIGYIYNNWMLLGLARLRARQVDGRVNALALWDGQAGLPGGTSTAVRDWRSFGEGVNWIAPMSVATSTWQQGLADEVRASVARSLGSQRIVSMLFADAVGFSKLPDESIPDFVSHFLGKIANVLDRQADSALTRNTWGDGLYFSFATPRGAGLFALDLCDAIRSTDWAAWGLPADLSLRVALHCGPAHEVFDPIIRQLNYSGAHVSRAARLEPVTPPGSVYASQPFAALCECEGIKEFICEYVGRMPLAKKYGEHPTFNVRRRR